MDDKQIVRINSPDALLYCDVCFDSEVTDIHETHDLRTMYRVDDDYIICQKCLDATRRGDRTDGTV